VGESRVAYAESAVTVSAITVSATTNREIHRYKAPRPGKQPQAASGMLDAVNRCRPWTRSDGSGGPIDDALDQLNEWVPGSRPTA
jgi:hypothetical protein